MKRTLGFLTLSLGILLVAACGREGPTPETRDPATAEPISAGARGTVVETVNSAGYTYVQIDTGSEKIWAAAPECQVKVGDQVAVPEGMPMRDFHSNALNRDFASIYFVTSILDGTGSPLAKGAGMPTGHPTSAVSAAPEKIDVSGIPKAEGGMTIGELFADKANLSGKQVTLRGKVVKFNAQIMGKNWLHLRDGSGDAAAGTNDLTVTTDAGVKVGDIVLVSGRVVVDKDFGHGYKYGAMIEDAKVTSQSNVRP